MAVKETKNSNGWLDWAYKEDSPYEGMELPVCKDFLCISQQCWEIIATSVVAILALFYAYPRLRMPETCPCACQRQESVGKRILLLLLCLAFGLEIGVKLATRRVFWIGKPSHLATMIQIFLLIAPPSRIVTAAFRLQMYMLIGIPLVVFYPIITMQVSLFETGISLIHHLLMLVIPFYLMHIGDPYIPEALGDFSWVLIAYVLLFLYHFLPLQLLTFVTNVDLSSMLYPVFLGQSHSRIYHLLTFCHQLLLIPTFGKLLVIIAKAFQILPCSFPLDETNVYMKCTKPRNPGIVSCCSGEALRHSSASGSGEECNTDEDSGCVGSWNMLNNGYRRCSERHTHSPYCSGYRPPCPQACQYRGCLNDHKEFNWCCNSDSVHTRCIVNGELVGQVPTNEASCKRWTVDKPSNIQGKTPPSGTGKNSLCRSFLLNDSQDSSPELPVKKTVLTSNPEASRSSYVKSHL